MISSEQHHERSAAVGSKSIAYTVSRSSRKTTRLVVDPNGQVEVRTDHCRSEESIEEFVRRRARWIFRQQEYFESFRPRDPRRRYVSGETVRYLGRQYRIRLQHGDDESVKLRGQYLVVRIASGVAEDSAQHLVRGWFQEKAFELLPKRIALCLVHASRHGIQSPPLIVRWMTRRWGSCTPNGRLVLNPLLLITPVDCVDYVVMHELCHLKYPTHSKAFYLLLDVTMPDWRRRRRRLEQNGRHLSL